MQFTNVVLPAPFGPRTPRISPRRIVRSTPSTAARPPNFFVMPVATRMGSPGIARRGRGTALIRSTRWARTFARRSDARNGRSPPFRRRAMTVMRPRGRKTMKNTMMRPRTVGWSSMNLPQMYVERSW